MESVEVIKDKFPCAGDINSKRFFAYPEGPQGQVVSENALFEGINLTFTSVSVTNAPRNDFQRIAFIGTKEGKLLKVRGETFCLSSEKYCVLYKV